MMKINILTGFPEFFTPFLNTLIMKRAIEKGLLEINVINLRDYASDAHRSIDDFPFGGGPGMVLKPEPMFRAMSAIENVGRVIYPSPQGVQFNHDLALEFSNEESLTFICGHYKNVDERVLDQFVDLEVSIGDYVLNGGEIPTIVMADAAIRLVPAVLDFMSVQQDSFYDDLLDAPSYTRPAVYEELKVPDVLLSGNHAKIEEWRKREVFKRTLVKRPDLLKKKFLTEDDKELLKSIYEELISN